MTSPLGNTAMPKPIGHRLEGIVPDVELAILEPVIADIVAGPTTAPVSP